MRTSLLLLCLLGAWTPRAAAEQWEISRDSSTFRVLFHRTGLLPMFSHDHVIEVRDFRGHFTLSGSTGSVRLEIAADKLQIDEPAAREDAGLKNELGPNDRSRIRERMRGTKGLDVARSARIVFVSERMQGKPDAAGQYLVTGQLTIRGITRPIYFPISMAEREGDWWVTGAAYFKPSQFGVVPFTFLGLWGIKDEAEVLFHLAARRTSP